MQFAGFSSESLCERIMDAQSSVLVTAGNIYRLFQTCGQQISTRRCECPCSLWNIALLYSSRSPFYLSDTQTVFTEGRSWSTWSRFQTKRWRNARKSKSCGGKCRGSRQLMVFTQAAAGNRTSHAQYDAVSCYQAGAGLPDDKGCRATRRIRIHQGSPSRPSPTATGAREGWELKRKACWEWLSWLGCWVVSKRRDWMNTERRVLIKCRKHILNCIISQKFNIFIANIKKSLIFIINVMFLCLFLCGKL